MSVLDAERLGIDLAASDEKMRSQLHALERDREITETVRDAEEDLLYDRAGDWDVAEQVLNTGDEGDLWEAARHLAETDSELAERFYQEWLSLDHEAARGWLAAYPKSDWATRRTPSLEDVRELDQTRQRFAKYQEVRGSVLARLAEIAEDPRGKAALPLARQLLAQLETGLSTPEEAVATVDHAVRLSDALRQEEADADSFADTLGGLDARLAEHAYVSGATDEEPTSVSREDREIAAKLELISPERIQARVEQESDPLMDSFERVLAQREGNPDPEGEAASDRLRAERRRQWEDWRARRRPRRGGSRRP
jgi:hypothetical protein